MIFMCQYQIENDKKTDTQAFFASMTPEQIAGELPSGVKQIGRWHDIPNGCGWAVIGCCQTKPNTYQSATIT